MKPVGPAALATGDLVEVVLHLGGEVVLHELAEVVFEQLDDAEGLPVRHECLAALAHIAAENGVDDRREGRRSADPLLFKRLDEGCFSEAGAWGGRVTLGLELGQLHGCANLECGKLHIGGLVGVAALFVLALFIRGEEPREGDNGAGGSEVDGLAICFGAQRHGRGLDLGVSHLAGDGALPNQVVEARLATMQRAGE